jgi:hypothetical protein
MRGKKDKITDRIEPRPNPSRAGGIPSAPSDAEILAIWQAGATLDDIAAACGTTVLRAAHDMNRVLNKQTIGMDFAQFRERLPPSP